MKTLTRLDRLDKARPVYVYGAGMGGKIVMERLAVLSGPPVAAVIDRTRTGALNGVPILSTDRFVANGDRAAPVLLASQYWPEIAGFLMSVGFHNLLNAYPVVERELSRLHRSPGAPPPGRRAALAGAASLALVAAATALVLWAA